MGKRELVDELRVLGGPAEYSVPTYEPESTHLQEVTRAERHLQAVLDAKSEEEFVDNLSAALFHLERVKQGILNKDIPLVVKISTVKIPYDNE